MRYSLSICHLYPDLMDTYGDKGNILTIINRCKWRGIKTSLTQISIGDKLDWEKFDIYFFGGGQDRQQILVGKDLNKKADGLEEAIENGAVLLSICGGYQLLQKYFKTLDGITIEGISLFDAYTLGSTTRMIQNLLIEINPALQSEIDKIYPTTNYQLQTTNLVGFENHSGKTFLNSNLQPLGRVIKGAGNNGEDKTEGAIYKNAFGCYLHGSLLPKNPHFADYLIAKALERKYGQSAGRRIKPLNDSTEWQAHESAIKRTRSAA